MKRTQRLVTPAALSEMVGGQLSAHQIRILAEQGSIPGTLRTGKETNGVRHFRWTKEAAEAWARTICPTAYGVAS